MISRFIELWRLDYSFKTYFAAALSALTGLAYTLFNGFLGIYFRSIWHGTICVYYLMLVFVRAFTVYSQHKLSEKDNLSYKEAVEEKRRTQLVTYTVMLLMNLALIVPIKVMIGGERSFDWGMIPAITVAVYATYRITFAVMNFAKGSKRNDPIIRQLRTAGLIDSLVTILTLQNTLIVAVDGGVTGSMKTFSIITSTVIWLFIVFLSIYSFISDNAVYRKDSAD